MVFEKGIRSTRASNKALAGMWADGTLKQSEQQVALGHRRTGPEVAR